MAYPRAGIDVVVSERRANHLLERIHFLVRATGRTDPTDSAHAVLVLKLAEVLGGERDRLVPAYLAPWIGDPLTDHWLEHAVLVRRVAPGKAALDAGVA